MSYAYPMLLDVTRRKIVIVGAGRVAARKAAGLVDAGAGDITVIAPVFAAAFPAAVKRVERDYDSKVLDGADLVFAATDRAEINDEIVRDARRLGILVNRADADEAFPGDFSTPAKFQDQSVIVTVSAASPALAAGIRDEIERRWDPRWTKMATAMRTLRPWVRDHPRLTAEQRIAVFRLLAGNEAMDVLGGHDIETLRAWLIERHPELV